MRATAPIGLGLESLHNEFQLERVVKVIGGFGWPDVLIVAQADEHVRDLIWKPLSDGGDYRW